MRIKAKQGWNVHIPDMNLSLQSGRDFIEVDETVFNNSIDARRVKDLIEIDDGSSKPKKKLTPKKPIYIEQVGATSFVVQNSEPPRQSNAIVYDPNNEADLRTVKSKQNLDAEAAKRVQKETVKSESQYETISKTTKANEPKTEEIKTNAPKVNESVKPEIKTEINTDKKNEATEEVKTDIKLEVKQENVNNQTNADDSSKVKDNKKSKKK